MMSFALTPNSAKAIIASMTYGQLLYKKCSSTVGGKRKELLVKTKIYSNSFKHKGDLACAPVLLF